MKSVYPQPSFGGRPPASSPRFAGAPLTKWILITLVALFMVNVIGESDEMGRIAPYFVMEGSVTHEIWRWITYPLINLNVGNWLFSLISLLVFGTLAEKGLGTRRYAMMLIYTVLVGALVYTIVSATSDLPSLPLSGGSGVAMSILIVLAMMYPDQPIQLMIPPIPLKVKYLVMFCVVVMVVVPIAQRTDPAEALANLSSIGVSYLCMKNMHWLDLGLKQMTRSHSNKKSKKKVGRKQSAGMKPRTELNLKVSKKEAEINKILDKVSAEGIGNLTEDEREILKFASKK